MKKTAAWNVMGVERSTQAIAEEAARRAGMSLADWLDEVVAEQATEQGVASEDLSEDESLDAIGDRLDQLTRNPSAQPQLPRRRARPRETNFAPEVTQRQRENAEARLETAISRLDERAARNEQRTARALETMAQWMERSETERARERSISATAEPVVPRDPPRPRMDLADAVERIHRRRGELDARQGLSPRDRPHPQDARPTPPRRPAAPAAPVRPEPAPAFAAPNPGNVDLDRLHQEIAGLNGRLEQMSREKAAPVRAPQPPLAADRRLTTGETDALRAELAAMRRALTELAPRNANVALEGAVVDLGQRLETMRKFGGGEALRPLEDMLLQVIEMLRRQDPQAAAKGVESDLKALSSRIEALTRAAVDPAVIDQIRQQTEDVRQMLAKAAASAPLGNLERQIENLANRADRLQSHPAPQPEIERLFGLFADMRAQIERAVSPTFFNTVEQRLESLSTRIDEAIKRPAPVFDASPIEELARRVDALKSAVEKQVEVQPAGTKLEAALADIGRKLDRPLPTPSLDARPFDELARRVDHLRTTVERQATATPANPRLEAALAEIARKLDRPAPVPALDARPFEEIARHVESLKGVVERQSATPATTARLETALAEISQKLDRAAPASTFDARPIEELSRRFETLRGAVERQATNPPAIAKLEAALADISHKLERAAGAPTVDPRPIEDLSHRLESLKAAVERQSAPPSYSNFETAFAELSRKLDRPMAAPAFDSRPLDELAQQVESLKLSVEQHSETAAQTAKLEGAIADIGRKLDRPPQGLADQMAIKSTLQALSARVEDGFRKIGEAAPDSGASVGALELELLDEIARGLQEMRGSIGRQDDFHASAIRMEAAIADLSSRMENANEPASDRAALNDTLQMLLSRLSDWEPQPVAAPFADSAELQELTHRIDALQTALASQSEIAPQLAAMSGELSEIRHRMSGQADPSNDTRALVGIVQGLSDKIDQRDASASDLRALETLAREVLAKPMRMDTAPLEAMIGALGHKIDDAAGVNFELGPLVEWMSRIETRLEGFSPAPFEQAIRDLGDRLDARDATGLDAGQIEQTAEIIAQRLEPRASLNADADLLLRHLSDIHERLDSLGAASGSSAALEKSVADLAAEFENTRELLASVVEPAAQAGAIVEDIADLKAEHVNAERRMATRLTKVQEILEQLSDRLRQIEENQEEPVRPPLTAPKVASPAASGFDFNDIPDRPRSATPRPAAAAPAAAPPVPPAARSMDEPAGFLLEPGSSAPRATVRIDEPRRAGSEAEDTVKSTDLQAHIAAARRAAMAEMNARREKSSPSVESEAASRRPASSLSALRQAQRVVGGRPVPFLIGATLLVAAATAALFELRGGHIPLIQKSENVPSVTSPLVQAPSTGDSAPTTDVITKDVAPKVDPAPTGSIAPAKPAADRIKPGASALPAPADLLAGFPAGQPEALKDAAIAGDASAETEIGLRYVEGRVAPHDPKIGARWLELAANQNAAYAQYRLGALYERGVGMAKDPELARAWYKKAAEGGNARALHNLAVMNAEDGGNGKPDYVEAIAGFRAAAELGVRDSQYNLGVLYGRGLGLGQDLTQSWMWFSLAAQQGDADAGKKRDEVAAKMDAKQLAAAAKLLAEIKIKTPLPAANASPQPPGGWDAPAPLASKPPAAPKAPPASVKS